MVTELDRRGLAVAAALSAVAGWVDAVAFLAIGGYFVSFMSGNTTRGAVDATTGGPWWLALVLLAGFVSGVAAAGVVQRLVPRRAGTAALSLVTALLLAAASAAALDLPVLVVGTLLAAGMGAVNVVFARDHAVSFGVTYMTGALVKATQGVVGAAWGERDTGWARYLLLWGAIAVGAVAGAAVSAGVGLAALWAAVVATSVLLVGSALSRPRATSARGGRR